MPEGAETSETEIVIEPGSEAIDVDSLPDVSAQVSVSTEAETPGGETAEASQGSETENQTQGGSEGEAEAGSDPSAEGE